MPETTRDSPRLLVVEDNETNRMIFRDILSTEGYQVLEACTAEEAFRVAGSQTPDLILMDIQLPDIDGLEAVRMFRQKPETRTVPIVALTAHALPSHRDQALAAGCVDFIAKPIRSATFRETVRSALQQGPEGKSSSEA